MKSLAIRFDNKKDLYNLPNNLEELECVGIKLLELPELPNTLKYLYCSVNRLKSLPKLPGTLIELYCRDNNLTELPKLPVTLQILSCYNNKLTELPELPNSLSSLFCHDNKLKNLPDLPDTLTKFSCFNNPFECPIGKDIIEKFKLNILKLYTRQKMTQFKTKKYQDFLLDKYYSKFADIVYNFDLLGIEFHEEVKQKYEHLFTGLQYNLI